MNQHVAILHTRLSKGGRSRFALAVIEFFNRLGLIPDLFAYDVIHKHELARSFGKETRFRWIRVNDWSFSRFSTYTNLLLNVRARPYLDEYHLIFNLTNHLLFLPRDERCIHYINFPANAWSDLYGISGIVEKLYWLPIRLAYRHLHLSQNTQIFVNSDFTKTLLLRTTSIGRNQADIHVLFPPVDIESYWSDKATDCRRPSVCSLGRFSARKQQLDQVRIAKQLPKLEFHIIGQVVPGESQAYFEMCNAYIERHGIENVLLHPNMKLPDVIDLLRASMFFLHTKQWEPFGMSTVEGVAAGCIPVVPNSGGQQEIVPIPELRFDSTNDAAQILQRLLRRCNHLDLMRKQLQQHIEKFSYENFQKELLSRLSTRLTVMRSESIIQV